MVSTQNEESQGSKKVNLTQHQLDEVTLNSSRDFLEHLAILILDGHQLLLEIMWKVNDHTALEMRLPH